MLSWRAASPPTGSFASGSQEKLNAAAGKIYFPPMRLCTDNGAMIAAAGIARLESMTAAERDALVDKLAFGVRPAGRSRVSPKLRCLERLLSKAALRYLTPPSKRPAFLTESGRFSLRAFSSENRYEPELSAFAQSC